MVDPENLRMPEGIEQTLREGLPYVSWVCHDKHVAGYANNVQIDICRLPSPDRYVVHARAHGPFEYSKGTSAACGEALIEAITSIRKEAENLVVAQLQKP